MRAISSLACTLPNKSSLGQRSVVQKWLHHFIISANTTLTPCGITVKTVPGSFELIYGSSRFASSGLVDAVIAIGCVIRGDTPHFDYICQGVTQGLAELNKEGKVPVIYGLLTCNTMEQAEQRSGGMLGNKGDECAITAIKMVKGWE